MFLCTRLFSLLFLAVVCVGSTHAMTVPIGHTLLRAEAGSTFDPAGPAPEIEVIGVPLGSFDFGGSIGVRDVGDTDTILRRDQIAEAGNETIPVEFIALQLRSVDPVDLSLFGQSGFDTIFITLDPTPTSGGTLTFDLGNFTFDGSLTANVEFRDSQGQFLGTNIETLNWTAAPWTDAPAPPLIDVPDVSNGMTPISFTEFGDEATIIRRGPHAIPEPPGLVLGIIGLLALGVFAVRMRLVRAQLI